MELNIPSKTVKYLINRYNLE